jgi:hypothetical protein
LWCWLLSKITIRRTTRRGLFARVHVSCLGDKHSTRSGGNRELITLEELKVTTRENLVARVTHDTQAHLPRWLRPTSSQVSTPPTGSSVYLEHTDTW